MKLSVTTLVLLLALSGGQAATLNLEPCQQQGEEAQEFTIKSVETDATIAASTAVNVVLRHDKGTTGHIVASLDVEGVQASVVEAEADEDGTTTIALDLPAGVPSGLGSTLRIAVSGKSSQMLGCVEADTGVTTAGEATQHGQEEVAAVSGSSSSSSFLWTAWRSQHKRTYKSDAEESERRTIFEQNLAEVSKHNGRKRKGAEHFTMGLNEFADVSAEEFAATHFGLQQPEAPGGAQVDREFYSQEPEQSSKLPAEVDWRTKKAVTPIKNQGQCGSCWSFATTGALEGAYAIKTGKLVSFSEQQLVSCDPNFRGCGGGNVDWAFKWIKQNHGICTESSYKYKSGNGSTPKCKKHCNKVKGAAPSKYVDVRSKASSLEAAVVGQPVAVAIDASSRTFQFYRKGVLTGNCGSQLDHAVLVVGYGKQSGKKMWIVKNSWGKNWGMDGYVLIQRGKNKCGILKSASYPVLD